MRAPYFISHFSYEHFDDAEDDNPKDGIYRRYVMVFHNKFYFS